MNAARFLRAAGVVGAIAAYQLAAHHAASTPDAHGLGLALVLAPILLIALNAVVRSPARGWLLPLWALACVALWLGRAPLTAHFGWGLWLEHASFNLALAWMFGRTLAHGREPLCTQFATMVHGQIEARVVRYTRHVTLAWTLFFVATAFVSTVLFACASIVAWSTFANYLALPLVGLMFVVEYACRRIALPDMEPSSIMDAVRAYTQSMQMRRGGAQ
ncbi:membrane protein [Caballeronia jiangsuensis]|nr:membrane protein [Caballeronia jiangsuensis]